MNGNEHLEHLEIERKFLIKKYEWEIDGEKVLDITQTYLLRNFPDVQRRIRKIVSEGKTVFFYTEKRFISPSVRDENEKEISSDEYDRLMNEKDSSLVPVVKRRRVFDYKSQSFEMDEYSFSDSCATLELELESEEQEIILPPFIDVIKEVTGDSRYSNAALAKAQKLEVF